MRQFISKTALKDRYVDYLGSDHWRGLRLQKLSRSGGRCQCCGSGEKITVHHREYHSWYDCSVDDLIVLCWTCHKVFHEALSINRTKPSHYSEAETIELILKSRNSTNGLTVACLVERAHQRCKRGGYSKSALRLFIQEIKRISRRHFK